MDADTVMHFPLVGIDVSKAFDRQPVRQTKTGKYAYTTPLGVNVRSFEPGTDRERGGSRAGLRRYFPTRPGNQRWVTQMLAVIVSTSTSAQG